jgi:putative aldouronate transport system substrate-binding protein
MKKLLSLPMVFVVSVALFAGGQSGQRAAQPVASDLYNPPGVMPIVKTPVTISILCPSSSDIPRGESEMTKWMEGLTGVHIDWVTVAGDAFLERMQLTIASASYPDMIVPGVSYRINKTTEQQFGMQGIIIPLNRYYDNVSVGYKAIFEQMPGMRPYMTAQDGNIYSMPNLDGATHIQNQNKLWMNNTWLANVGKAVPTTTEELRDVLRAFKNNDANRNGNPNDEIPLSSAGSAALDVFLMNPFQLTPAEERLYLENGKVTFSVTQPGYRRGLEYIASLYAEGLINPELFVWNQATQVNTNENGREPVLGSILAMHPGNFADLSGYPNHSKKWEQYTAIPPIKGPDGVARSNYNAYASTYQTGVAMITRACTYPEAAFRMVDYLATYEGTIITTNGPKGEGWRDALPGELNLNGTQAKVVPVPAERRRNWGGWDQLMGRAQTPDYLNNGLAYDNSPYASNVDPMQGRHVIIYKGSLPHVAIAQPLNTVFPPLYYNDAVISDVNMLATSIKSYADEMMVAFVTGRRTINDTEWNAYMRQLDSLGLVRYLQILQQTYDASAFAKR